MEAQLILDVDEAAVDMGPEEPTGITVQGGDLAETSSTSTSTMLLPSTTWITLPATSSAVAAELADDMGDGDFTEGQVLDEGIL